MELRQYHLVARHADCSLCRMWNESQATAADLDRVAALVRSHLSVVLADEASLTWEELEKDLLEADYRDIRDRQMDLMEREGGMMHRLAVRRLREKIAVEAAQVIVQQR